MPDRHKPRMITEGRWLNFVARGGWEYAERRAISGIVGIVAVTDDRRLILVEQYRPPVDAPVIELPAGLVGDEPGRADEPLVEAARRELIEEAGYDAATITVLTTGVPSAGATDERITLVHATGLKRISAGGGDAHENITVHEVPLDALDAWLVERQAAGRLIDLKIYAGLYLAQR